MPSKTYWLASSRSKISAAPSRSARVSVTMARAVARGSNRDSTVVPSGRFVMAPLLTINTMRSDSASAIGFA